jgi:hypothetical protein
VTLLTDWQDAHKRWVATWDRLPAYERVYAPAHMVDEYLDGWDLSEIAEKWQIGQAAVAAVVCAGVNAERARLAARVPRGREPPVREETTSTTSTEPGET